VKVHFVFTDLAQTRYCGVCETYLTGQSGSGNLARSFHILSSRWTTTVTEHLWRKIWESL